MNIEEEIKHKMEEIKTRWAGKPDAVPGTVESIRRQIDRMIYRELGRNLRKKFKPSPKVRPPEENLV